MCEKQNQEEGCGWQEGEAPRDGEWYLAEGVRSWEDESGGFCVPFLSRVRYALGRWVFASVERHPADQVVEMEYWIALPGTEKPMGKTEFSRRAVSVFAGAVGEGDMEAAEEARAMDGYQAYANYLRDEGHIVPDWHQVPEDLQLAFVEFACRIAARKGTR